MRRIPGIEPELGRRKLFSAVAALAVLLVIAPTGACGSSDDDEPSAAPPPTVESQGRPRTASTSVDDGDPGVDDAEVVERYEAFWDIRFEVNREPVNPTDPRLAEYATGAQLENVLAETNQKLEQGLALRRPEPSVYERRVKVVSADGDTATLQDCVTNDGVVYRVASGEVVDDAVVTRSLLATMRRVDGVWKLADTRVLQEWEGVAGCATSADFS